MNGRIFVHIGLPKTATTTLQTQLFPAISSEEIHYHGVIQPRQENLQDNFYTIFCEAVYSGKSLEDVRSVVENKLNYGSTIIISEEMFTVSTKDASWRVKLKNLSKLLNGLDYTLILTVREPVAAIFSYYIELNEQFARERKGFVDLALNDNRMYIFHYKKLIDELFMHFDKEKIFVKKFEDIIVGNIEDMWRLITLGRREWHGLQLKTHNDKKQSGNFVYTGKYFTLADVVRRLVSLLGINDMFFFVTIKKILAPFVYRMESVNLYKTKVIKPTKEEMGQLKDYLRAETAALEEHFGIRYE